MQQDAVRLPSGRSVRMAAALYLLVVASGFVSLLYVSARVIVPSDGPATLANLRDLESLFRVGIAVELVGEVVFLLAVLALFQVFRRVDPDTAALMAVLGAISVPVSFVAAGCELGALTLATGRLTFPGVQVPELDGIAYVLVRLHGQLLTVASVFWGLWLFPLGMLELRSSFVPRVVGPLVIVAAVGYVIAALGAVVLPGSDAVAGVARILEGGELATVFWLLVASVRPGPTRSAGRG